MPRLLIMLALMPALALQAQTTTISPFSQINVGDVDGPIFSRNFAMGKLSYGLSSPYNVNPYNPATYSDLVWTNFEVSVRSKNYWLESGSQQQAANKTHFNSLSMGIPIADYWGASFGITPISHVGYDYSIFDAVVSDTTIVPFENAFLGSGGLNRFYFGNGFNLNRKLYFGFNLSYYFGDMQYEEIIIFTESEYLNTGSLRRVEAGGLYMDFGLQYRMDLKKDWKLNIGMVFEPLQGLKANQSIFNFTYSGNFGRTRIIDTVSFDVNSSFSIVLPPKFGFGVLLNRSEKLSLGLDAELVRWSMTNYNSLRGLKDAWTVRMGGEYIDDDNRYKFRMGLRYGRMPIDIDGSDLNEMALSAGVAIPFRSKDKLSLTELNIGAEFGQRGKKAEGLLLERFINVHVGLVLNNKWFLKRKYD